MKALKSEIVIEILHDGSYLCKFRDNNDNLIKHRYFGDLNKSQAKKYFISYLTVYHNINF